MSVKEWKDNRIIQEQIEKYTTNGKDFIDQEKIINEIKTNTDTDIKKVKDILEKSLSINTLSPAETATLLNVTDPDTLSLMKETALKVKQKVYDNRIVTFAPLYLSSKCINNCLYCGFKNTNTDTDRKVLSMDEIEQEIKVLAGKIGHKRLIVVYGEHPDSDIDYMCESIKKIYSVKEKARIGYGQIRRINVNAAPLSIEDLKRLKDVGLGTYQVFQETYHKDTYSKIHPANTLKGNYQWRLYAMHRAFEAGIDDVGLGALFGLYNWKYEVMGLLYHSLELEDKFGIGPHTISFPRLEPAVGTSLNDFNKYITTDEEFKKLVTVIRLSVPHTGMILTARENAQMRNEVIKLGCTQTDASTQIGIGEYSKIEDQTLVSKQDQDKQQFILGDTRSLDTVIKDLADMGFITSFCTAGYRCGRTGECIMDMLKDGSEGKFCKLNAILTYREWLDDFATPETKAAGEKILATELNQVKTTMPKIYPRMMDYYNKIANGERDLYF